MKILAIETATEACSVALLVDGELLSRHAVAPRQHTQLVLPWAGELLAEAGLARTALDALAVGRGPGAFTGVRLAIALVQGLALALDRPVLPVSTLAVLAMQGGGPEILAAIDARMGELYLGRFRRDDDGLVGAAGEEWLSAAADVAPATVDLHGVGTGFAAGDGALVARLGPHLSGFDAGALPDARDLARLAARDFARGRALPAERLEPAYLRDKVALTLAEQGKPAPRRD